MNDTMQVISVCATIVLLLAILIGGPAACSMHAQEEATKRAASVCEGDLKTDAARAAACVVAVGDAKKAGFGGAN